MKDLLKKGGDTDTNCCITGGLLGAYYGFDKLPE
jgi:ADP-ribosylglycohydrolase